MTILTKFLLLLRIHEYGKKYGMKDIPGHLGSNARAILSQQHFCIFFRASE